MKNNKFECSLCRQKCFHDCYPEVVFYTFDEIEIVICENCSINYEMRDNEIRFRQDLTDEGYRVYEPWITNRSIPKLISIDVSKIRGGFYNG